MSLSNPVSFPNPQGDASGENFNSCRYEEEGHILAGINLQHSENTAGFRGGSPGPASGRSDVE